jgi:NADPH:quinone reductase-like Zn-dependent oxidoreductase
MTVAGNSRSWHVERFDDLNGLALRRDELPTPGPRQALVRVHASSVNQRDLMVARGFPAGGPPRPGLIPLSDGAGSVVAVGEGTTRVAVGTRVAAAFRQGWIDGASLSAQSCNDLGAGLDGMLTEYAVFSEEGLVTLPQHLSYEEGATLPCAALTAWNALFVKNSVGPGDVVLTQGSGGVSVFALQFAKLAGARVIVTTSSPEKAERLRGLGADEVIDYRAQPDWQLEVLRRTSGNGADVVVEIGGPGTLPRSLAACREGGRVVLVGLLTGFDADLHGAFMTAFIRDVTLNSVHVGSRRSFEAMNRAIDQAMLRPVIGSTFGFEDAPEAYRHMAGGKHFGKIVITHQ